VNTIFSLFKRTPHSTRTPFLFQIHQSATQITHHKSVNEKLAHEIALLKRFKFAKRSEQLTPDQASLLDDLIDTDITAIEVLGSNSWSGT